MILERARATAACLAALLSMTVAADAQQRNTSVPRSEAQVLLDMPGLERGIEQNHYLGWDNGYSVETSYAISIERSGGFPMALAVKQQLAKGYIWQASTMDEAWVRKVVNVFKDKPVTITRTGRTAADAYLNTALFSSGNIECVGYTFRRHAKGIAGAGSSGEAGYYGYYCGAPGAKIGEAEIPRIVGGIYTRADGKIQRAYELDTSPIPDRMQR